MIVMPSPFLRHQIPSLWRGIITAPSSGILQDFRPLIYIKEVASLPIITLTAHINKADGIRDDGSSDVSGTDVTIYSYEVISEWAAVITAPGQTCGWRLELHS